MSNVKSRVISNLAWKFAERIGAQGVSFIISIVLARLLLPEEYGVITIVLIFINLANVFVMGGFGNSLIQKKNADNIDFSTVMFFSVGVGLIMYVLIWIISPFIAEFYEMPILVPVLKVMGLRLPIAGFNSVQQAYVQKNMIFKKFFFSTLFGTIGSGIIGIFMACKGFGVWALVAQYLFNSIVDTLILWCTVKWRPIMVFSIERMFGLFSYGWKLLCSELINVLYMDLRSLLIGKVYSSTDLAYYNRGEQFPKLIVNNINNSISTVLFPAMSQLQEDKLALKSAVRTSISVSTYLMLPLMVILAVCGEPLIRLLLTEKWLVCVPFLQIACFSQAFQPIQTANLQAIRALGRSDLVLKMEIVKKLIGIIIILIAIPFGIHTVAISSIIYTIIASLINTYPNKKLLSYGYLEQIKDIFSTIIASFIMGLIINLYRFVSFDNSFIQLFIQSFSGIIVYCILSYLLKIEVYTNVSNRTKQYLFKTNYNKC